MKLPELTQVQFQSAARSQEFDPLKLPDPNPSLQQNLAAIQNSFATLAEDDKLNAPALYADSTGEGSLTETIGKFSELLPQAVKTLSEVQQVDVAIQMARADDQYYQMLRQGLIPPNGEILAFEQDAKAKKELTEGAAEEATQVTRSYDIPRGILNLSNHGEIYLKRKLANHMFTHVYPEWMTTQLEINDSTVMVDDGQGGTVEVRINDPNLPDFQFKQVMAHLRTAFMGHELLADINNDLIQKEMAIGFATDAKLERAHTRKYRANDGKNRFKVGFNEMLDDFNSGNDLVLTPFKTNVASMPDEKGIGYRNSNAEFYGSMLNHVKTTAANGAEYNLGEFLTKAKFDDGKTFMERAPGQARLLMRTYRDERRKYLANKRKADEEELKFGVTTFLADCAKEGNCTNSDLVEFKQLLGIRGAELGISVTELQGVVSRSQRLLSVEGAPLNEYRKQIELALANGVANSNMDAMQNRVMIAEYGEKVKKQEERTQSQEYKDGSTMIEKTIKGTATTLVDDQGKMKSFTFGANRHYQRMYDREFANLQEKNKELPEGSRLSQYDIARKAEGIVLGQWEKDRVDPTNDYYVDPKNGDMPNYPVAPEEKARLKVTSNMNALVKESKTQAGVLQNVVNNPTRVFTSEEALAAVQLFQTTGRIDSSLQDKAKLINDGIGRIVITNPIQLALAAAVGHGHLKPEELNTVQPPAVVRRLDTRGRRQYMKDLLQLGGSTYTNLAKYRPAGPGSGMPVRGSMANRVQTLSPGVQGLAQLVRSGEGDYTSMYPSENYPEMTNMVIRTELVQFQKDKLRDGRKSAAAGGYQFLYPEQAADLAGLPPDARFTPENQDRMFIATLMNKRGREAIAQFLNGSSTNIELAIDQFAMEFASIEYRNNRGYYPDQTPSISRDRMAEALLSAREEMMRQAR